MQRQAVTSPTGRGHNGAEQQKEGSVCCNEWTVLNLNHLGEQLSKRQQIILKVGGIYNRERLLDSTN